MQIIMRTKQNIQITQECTNTGRHVAFATKFRIVAPNICGLSVWNLLLMPEILRWFIDFFFWEICKALNNLRCSSLFI